MNKIKQRIELVSEVGISTGFMELEVYKGFSSISDVETFMYGRDIPEKGYMIVKFFDMYYAILYKDANNMAIIGIDVCWEKVDGHFSQGKTKNFTAPYKSDKVQKTGYSNKKIIEDMYFLDDDIEVYNTYKNGWRNVLNTYQYAPAFLDYLGRTFYLNFFKSYDLEKLHQYFKKSDILFLKHLMESWEATELNPFRGEAIINNEKVAVRMPS